MVCLDDGENSEKVSYDYPDHCSSSSHFPAPLADAPTDRLRAGAPEAKSKLRMSMQMMYASAGLRDAWYKQLNH